jgi:microcystin-dependent protein
MAAIDFPASPTVGQNFTAANGATYQWNGTVWLATGAQPLFGQTVSFYGTFSTPANTIPNTPTVIALLTIRSGNEGGWFSTSTGRFTPPAGRYVISGGARMYTGGGQSLMQAGIYKNGTLIVFNDDTTAAANFAANAIVEATLDLNGTDYIEFKLTSANFNAGGDGWFGAHSIFLSTPYVANTGGGTFVSGDVKASASPNPQAGWYLCDGSTKNRTSDAALFASIGTTWGAGDGSTTFNLPDFRGRTLFGVDGGAGRLGNGTSGGITTPAILGATGGQQAHIQTAAELAAHQHPYAVGGVVANGVNVRGTSGDGTNPGFPNTEVVGSSAAMNVTPPAAVIYWYIKA